MLIEEVIPPCNRGNEVEPISTENVVGDFQKRTPSENLCFEPNGGSTTKNYNDKVAIYLQIRK